MSDRVDDKLPSVESDSSVKKTRNDDLFSRLDVIQINDPATTINGLGPFVLRRIVSHGQLKKALVDMITALPDDEASHNTLIGILRLCDNPRLLYNELRALGLGDKIKQTIKSVFGRAVNYFWVLIGMALTWLFTYVRLLFV